MPITYKKIASVAAGSGGATAIEFTSIPGTYTDLILLFSFRASIDVSNFDLEFNDLSTNQTMRQIYGNGASAASNSASNFGVAYGVVNPSTATASTFANAQIYIPNYAGSTNKSFSVDGVSENNGTTAYQTLAAGLWSSTAAITKMKFWPSGKTGNFAEHSTAVLYGIKKD